jgi:hypothetical protein
MLMLVGLVRDSLSVSRCVGFIIIVTYEYIQITHVILYWAWVFPYVLTKKYVCKYTLFRYLESITQAL